jgi:hypothetical protein
MKIVRGYELLVSQSGMNSAHRFSFRGVSLDLLCDFGSESNMFSVWSRGMIFASHDLSEIKRL